MASSRSLADTTTDRGLCSMCLEDFTGRCPKILPCSHTFCLSCLTELVRQAEMKSSTESWKDTEENTEDLTTTRNKSSLPLVFLCPICRAEISVPTGGVVDFESNVTFGDEKDYHLQTPRCCGVCDGDQEAEYSCTECQKSMCSPCHRVHKKLMTGHQVHHLAATIPDNSDDMKKMMGKCEDQINILEMALGRMVEDKKEAEIQRQAMADEIDKRYNILLAYASQAMEESKRVLEMKAKIVQEKLSADITAARHALGKLWHQLAEQVLDSEQTKLPDQQQTVALVNETNLQNYAQYISRNNQRVLFTFQTNDTAITSKSVKEFVGSVKYSDQDVESFPGIMAEPSDCIPTSGDINERNNYTADFSLNKAEHDESTCRYRELDTHIAHIQNKRPKDSREILPQSRRDVNLIIDTPVTDSQFQKHLTKRDNSDMCQELTSDLNVTLDSFTAATNSISSNPNFLQELMLLKEETVQLRAYIVTIQSDMKNLHQENTYLRADVTALQEDNLYQEFNTWRDEVKLLQDVTSKCNQVATKLQTEVNGLQEKQNENFASLKANVTTLQGKAQTLSDDVANLRTDVNTLCGEKLKPDQLLANLKTDVSTLQMETSQLRKKSETSMETIDSKKKSKRKNCTKGKKQGDTQRLDDHDQLLFSSKKSV